VWGPHSDTAGLALSRHHMRNATEPSLGAEFDRVYQPGGKNQRTHTDLFAVPGCMYVWYCVPPCLLGGRKPYTSDNKIVMMT